jgi:diguanylate cyclase (GGDEF)-like protein
MAAHGSPGDLGGKAANMLELSKEMNALSDIVVLCSASVHREDLVPRLAPLTARFAETSEALLRLAGATPGAVVLLVPSDAEAAAGMAPTARDLGCAGADCAVLVLVDAPPGGLRVDAVLSPHCSNEELVRTCRLLKRLAEARVERTRIAAALRAAQSHQEVMTEAHQQELQKMTEAALTDPLTGLANRRHLEHWLEAQFAESKEQGRNLGVAVVDVDLFKAINERFGHAAGDVTLQAVADALRAGLRQGDFVGRIGGDEFAVVLPGLGRADLLSVGRRLWEGVRSRSVAYEGQTIAARVSVGLSTFPGDGSTQARELVRHADLAMLDAKRRGRDRVCAWEPPMAFSPGTQEP